jgi:hypothetical protein
VPPQTFVIVDNTITGNGSGVAMSFDGVEIANNVLFGNDEDIAGLRDGVGVMTHRVAPPAG